MIPSFVTTAPMPPSHQRLIGSYQVRADAGRCDIVTHPIAAA
jgi:hypothetical protein